jgi:hypothetical protein
VVTFGGSVQDMEVLGSDAVVEDRVIETVDQISRDRECNVGVLLEGVG